MMSGKLKIAFGINLFVALIGGLVGVSYLLSGEITSYHRVAIGVEWDSLAPGVQVLLIILMKGTGVALFVMALSITILSLIPFRRGDNWSRGAILAIGMSCWIPMLAGAIYVASTTGAASPWWLNASLNLGLIISFFLSRELKNNN